MGLYVHKYGGTSVGSIERINAVAERICTAKQRGDDIVVVVSAMAGETNRLISLGHMIDPNASPREMDVLLSTGEQVTIALLAIALQKLGCLATSLTSDQVGIETSEHHGKARIQHINTARIKQHLSQGEVVIIAGFQGRNFNNDITTLGRGGSDISAVAIAAALQATECLIYTDVNGVYTTDPNLEPNARCLEFITFEEMQEMASLGAKVLQIHAVEYAGKYQVPLRVLSSFNDSAGTLISYDGIKAQGAAVTGIAFNAYESCLTIENIPSGANSAAKILEQISQAQIDIDIIIQNGVLKNSTALTFTINQQDYGRAKALLEAQTLDMQDMKIHGLSQTAKVSIVGAGMWHYPGVAATMFKTLASENIKIHLISTSEIKISVILNQKDMKKAVRVLHKAFNLESM